MKTHTLFITLPVALISGMIVAAVAQQPKTDLSEVSRLRLLTSYQKVVMLNNQIQTMQSEWCTNFPQCKQTREKLQEAINDYNANASKTVENEKLPKGTVFNVDPDSGAVTVKLPEAEKK